MPAIKDDFRKCPDGAPPVIPRYYCCCNMPSCCCDQNVKGEQSEATDDDDCDDNQSGESDGEYTGDSSYSDAQSHDSSSSEQGAQQRADQLQKYCSLMGALLEKQKKFEQERFGNCSALESYDKQMELLRKQREECEKRQKDLNTAIEEGAATYNETNKYEQECKKTESQSQSPRSGKKSPGPQQKNEMPPQRKQSGISLINSATTTKFQHGAKRDRSESDNCKDSRSKIDAMPLKREEPRVESDYENVHDNLKNRADDSIHILPREASDLERDLAESRKRQHQAMLCKLWAQFQEQQCCGIPCCGLQQNAPLCVPLPSDQVYHCLPPAPGYVCCAQPPPPCQYPQLSCVCPQPCPEQCLCSPPCGQPAEAQTYPVQCTVAGCCYPSCPIPLPYHTNMPPQCMTHTIIQRPIDSSARATKRITDQMLCIAQQQDLQARHGLQTEYMQSFRN